MNALNSGYQAQGNVVAEKTTITIDVRCVVAYRVAEAFQIGRAGVVVCSFDTPWFEDPSARWAHSSKPCEKGFLVGSSEVVSGNW